jgi:hypothetical protein
MKRQSLVKVGDLVRAKSDIRFYGFVTYIDTVAGGDYYVEVIYDQDADPLYFYDDELEVLKLVKE